MASIEKVGDKWKARIRRTGSKSVSQNFSSRTDAKAWATKTEAAMIALKHQDIRSIAKTSVRDLIDHYNDEVGGEKGFQKNKTAVLKTLKRDLGDILMPNLTVERLTNYIKDRKASGAVGVTIAVDLSYLKAVLQAERDLRHLPIDINIVSKARSNMKYLGLSTKSRERDRRPTPEELDQLKKWFVAKGLRQKVPMPDIIDFAVSTAMRLSEITRLCWSDLNSKDKTILIRDRKDPRAKQGNNQVVPLLVDALKIVLSQPKSGDLIFPYSSNTISSIFPRAVNSLKINDLRFHDLRHEGTSRLFEDGYGIQEVAVFTGHKDWKQLQRYTQIRAKNLHKDRDGNDRRTVID